MMKSRTRCARLISANTKEERQQVLNVSSHLRLSPLPCQTRKEDGWLADTRVVVRLASSPSCQKTTGRRPRPTTAALWCVCGDHTHVRTHWTKTQWCYSFCIKAYLKSQKLFYSFAEMFSFLFLSFSCSLKMIQVWTSPCSLSNLTLLCLPGGFGFCIVKSQTVGKAALMPFCFAMPERLLFSFLPLHLSLPLSFRLSLSPDLSYCIHRLASKVEMYYSSQTKKCLLTVQRLVLLGPS